VEHPRRGRIQVWNTVVAAVSTAWNRIVTVIRTVVGNVLGFLRTWGPAILAVIAPVIGIPLLIASHWNQIVAVARSVWSAVVSAVTSPSTGSGRHLSGRRT
jgi:hypothetical protein